MLKEKNILLCISGGIAAYKMANLASALVKLGANVDVIMTRNATNFIHPLTFESLTKHKCYLDTFDRRFEYDVEHISLAKKADVVLIAPATANVIGKIANGIADDMLTTTILACQCPVLISPAMNTRMLLNSIVVENIEKLKRHGFEIIEPSSGYLACGDVGSGKLPDMEVLLDRLEASLSRKDLSKERVLITAGPTKEAIDPVRFISNHSTGKMGIELARMAAYRGADVTLVHGPVSTPIPSLPNLRVVSIQSANDMFEAVKGCFEHASMVIKAAAVADFRPKTIADEKIKKSGDTSSIELERTTDILQYLGERKGDRILCGFSMETENMLENSKAKLQKKNLDMIVANNLKQEGAGFGVDTNIVTLITKSDVLELAKMSKRDVADRILDTLLILREESGIRGRS